MAQRHAGAGAQASPSSRARAKTASSISLGELAGERVLLRDVVAAEQRVGADLGLGAVAEARLRARRRMAERAQRAQRAVPGERRRARRAPGARSSSAQLLDQVGQAGVALVGRRPVGRRRAADDRADVGVARAAGRRRDASEVGWLAKPARCSAPNSQSPERSPVNTRPVRLPPCAAGARPTTTSPRLGVAEAGHRPRPVALAAVAPRRVGGAPASRQATSRGQRRQPVIRRSRALEAVGGRSRLSTVIRLSRVPRHAHRSRVAAFSSLGGTGAAGVALGRLRRRRTTRAPRATTSCWPASARRRDERSRPPTSAALGVGRGRRGARRSSASRRRRPRAPSELGAARAPAASPPTDGGPDSPEALSAAIDAAPTPRSPPTAQRRAASTRPRLRRDRDRFARRRSPPSSRSSAASPASRRCREAFVTGADEPYRCGRPRRRRGRDDRPRPPRRRPRRRAVSDAARQPPRGAAPGGARRRRARRRRPAAPGARARPVDRRRGPARLPRRGDRARAGHRARLRDRRRRRRTRAPSSSDAGASSATRSRRTRTRCAARSTSSASTRPSRPTRPPTPPCSTTSTGSTTRPPTRLSRPARASSTALERPSELLEYLRRARGRPARRYYIGQGAGPRQRGPVDHERRDRRLSGPAPGRAAAARSATPRPPPRRGGRRRSGAPPTARAP